MTNDRKVMNESPARLRRRRSVAKAQRNWIIALAVLIVLLVVAFCVADYYVNLIFFEDSDGTQYVIKKKDGIYVMCTSSGVPLELSVSADTSQNTYIYVTDLGTEVKVDPDTGVNTVYSVIDTLEGEYVGTMDRIQMFKQIKQAEIDSLEIHNAHGVFTFYVDKDGEFQIKGHEGIPFNQVMFSSLAVSCGYSLSTRKIVDPIKDENGLYTEYGLEDEKRVDEEGKEYDYSPYWYRITDINGNYHTVIIGDPVPSQTGYYVKLPERDAVYVMNYSLSSDILNMYGGSYESIDSVLHEPIEKFISPMVTYPMEMNNYFDVTAFIIYDGEVLSKIPEDATEEELEKLDFDPIVSFRFWDLDDRTGTFYANTPYILGHPEGYVANDAAIDSCLQSFYTLAPLGVVKLGPNDEDMKTFGLEEPEFVIYFNFLGEYEHTILISEETERGTRYVSSGIYDFIVEVNSSSLAFLSYETNDWVDDLYFSMNIAWATKIEVEYGDNLYTFLLDNSLSDSVTNPTCSEEAKKKGTISSDMLAVIATDSKGNKMEAISGLTVVDKSGYKWVIDYETVKAYDPSGEKTGIKGGYYAKNSRGEEVVALQGYINSNDGRQIYVSADKIRIMNSEGVLIKEYLRYGVSNFRRLFSSLLYASKQGSIHGGLNGLTEAEVDKILETPDKYDVRIRVETSYKDTYYEFRYYNYSERAAMITVNGGDGEFRVLRSFTKKIAEDAAKVIDGRPINATDKYS